MYDAIRQHIPFLRNHAEALAGSTMGAEDLLREVLLHALAKSYQVRAGTDLRGWLFTIMHNQHARRDRLPRGARCRLSAGQEVCSRESAADLDAVAARLGQALALLPDAHRRLMAAVASESERQPPGAGSETIRPINPPASRRVHAKTANSPRWLAEPSRRLSGRPRIAAMPDRR